MCLWCAIVKGEVIIICIHVCPKWRTNFNSEENGGRKSFSNKTKTSVHLPQWENEFMVPKHEKKKRLLCELVLILIGRWTLIPKNSEKRGFSYETKASISFIPMTRMSLWCLIMKRKEIIMWICVSRSR